jgi:hypothetical protein
MPIPGHMQRTYVTQRAHEHERRDITARVGRAVVAMVLVVPLLAALVPVPAASAASTSVLVPVGPIRLADTRTGEGFSRPAADRIRVVVAGRDGVPGDAVAAAVTLTATDSTAAAYLTAWPSGTAQPLASNLNVDGPGRTVANSAIVALGAGGAIDVMVSAPAQLVVDLTAVFVPADSSASGRFVATDPVRVADTRWSGVPVAPGGDLLVPLPPGVPSDATALAVNVTAVTPNRTGYFTAYPAGASRPWSSVLNTDRDDQVRAATAIVPVDAGGLRIFSSSGGHVALDVVGWFTGASAPDSADGLFVPSAPARILDTRPSRIPVHPGGTIEVMAGDGAAVVVNTTMAEPRSAGYLAAHAAGTPVPETSTVNAAGRFDAVANLSIVRRSTRGIALSSPSGAHVVLDVAGWFTGAPVAAALPVPGNVAPPPGRVLLIGDSTLAGVRWYGNARVALQGFDYTLDAESCRRLVGTSCRGREGYAPSNAVNAILSKPGTFDTVVLMTGYDDWGSYFASAVGQVVAAARAKGARHIVWLTYRVDVGYVAPSNAASDGTYRSNNRILREVQSLYPDLVIADWDAYSRHLTSWFTSDGIHLTPSGSYGVADYISRFVSWWEVRPCPQPWTPTESIPNPCDNPDLAGRVPDLYGLYLS